MSHPPAPQNPRPRRLGPRPLPLHLAAATAVWTSSRAGLTLWKSGSLAWKPDLAPAAGELRAWISGTDPKALDQALEGEIRRRLLAMMDGILAYRRHPYSRTLSDPLAIWAEGAARLLDYGGGMEGEAQGPPLLVVPSLINRAYILDLSPRKSLLRYLAGRGFRSFLVDWGRPGATERGFTLSDYIAGTLERVLDAVRRLAGRPPVVVGYCMGGLLALALAVRRPSEVAGLALLATPWDFHCERGEQARLAAAMLGPLEPVIERLGELPVDALQAMFASLDPLSAARKFCAFAKLAESGDGSPAAAARIEDFVALEDWLNDGIPLVAGVARECLRDWYGENQPARGLWRVAGTRIGPELVSCPSLVVVPGQDRIVPPESARSLADALPGARVMMPPLGHIGMIVGSRAVSLLWEPLSDWLRGAGETGRPMRPARAPTDSPRRRA